ncbi:PRC-barrel domain-containing protein [Clostridium ljungdahlii]|uniref:PRC-barrel domain-containing protein n=1 Tax=Clostridium ljungdahlii TaxID=1538 RepID=UPI00386D6A78
MSLTSVIVVTNVNKDKYFQFNDVKRMNVVDEKGCLIGMVEDILFDEESFCIKAVILSTGFINNFIKGKKILLIDDLTLGEDNVFYRGKKENLKFFNSPHALFNSDKASERK